ncbi:MAG: NADH-quinone oxidoreductase subunit I [Deltaproteobacteria bacterium]|nr:NADH-quinone oxidoreductase subunit I [Deltaproteobacteria bacterium]
MAVKKINRPPQNWWERLYVFEIARGLGITMKHALKTWFKPGHLLTYQYPEEKRPMAERFRGRHRLRRRDDGSPVCVACFCCQTACPPNAIEIVAEESENPDIEKRPESFKINMLRCIYCGMCVEACPKDAIYMTKVFEFANQTREQLQFDLKDLLDPEKGEQ